ncbi:SDR family oxidoreductase [Streptomyces sp. NPDC094437]|uniref:SDR family oxidoreductase n=1 Tax=Streptomyces sp. NPDC094437 TaxID=3366060 RepID=UPI00381B3F6B
MNTTPTKIAVVTGAGSGIGRAVARELLAAGWSVALAGRRLEPLEETAKLTASGPATPVRGAGLSSDVRLRRVGATSRDGAAPDERPARALPVPTDVSDPDQVSHLFTTAAEHFGRIDLLFNNAGVSGPGGVPVEDLPFDAWRHVVDTNLTGAFLCAQAAYRHMKNQSPQGGRIINNGSISAHTPRPHSIAYTATKHALTGLTKSLSLDGRSHHIAVGQIDIGNAATDMTDRMSAGVLQANGEMAPEPVMDVAHVARTVRHMAELPLDANVQFATVLATTMPYVGRG